MRQFGARPDHVLPTHNGLWFYYLHTGDLESIKTVYEATKTFPLETYKFGNPRTWFDWGKELKDIPLRMADRYRTMIPASFTTLWERARLAGQFLRREALTSPVLRT